MITFGAGVLVGVPLYDATGVAITNPSPIQFGILQDVTIDESWETKELYGALQFPVAVGRGKGKVTIKAKAANFNAELCNTFLYGITATSAYDAIYNDLTGTSVPTSTFQVTPTGAGTWVADLGVTSGTNQAAVPYTRVGTATTPTAGQYNVAAGVYTFSNLDYGRNVFITYAYSRADIASGRKLTVINEPMGVQPVFQCHFQAQYLGKTVYIEYPNAIATKFTSDFKNDDFTIPDFEISAFSDNSGNISYRWYYE